MSFGQFSVACAGNKDDNRKDKRHHEPEDENRINGRVLTDNPEEELADRRSQEAAEVLKGEEQPHCRGNRRGRNGQGQAHGDAGREHDAGKTGEKETYAEDKQERGGNRGTGPIDNNKTEGNHDHGHKKNIVFKETIAEAISNTP